MDANDDLAVGRGGHIARPLAAVNLLKVLQRIAFGRGAERCGFMKLAGFLLLLSGWLLVALAVQFVANGLTDFGLLKPLVTPY